MSNSLLQKSFKSLTCSEEGHENQPLRSICISQQCEHTPVMCDLCSLYKHTGHDQITLKVFFKQLFSIELKSQNAIPLCAGVDQVFQKISRKLHEVDKNFTNPELVFKTFEQWRNLNIKYALDFYKLSEKISELVVQSEDHQKVQKLNNFIKTCYFKYFGKLEEEDWNKCNIGQALLNKKIQGLNNTLESLQKLHTTHKLNDYEALNLFPLAVEENRKIKIYFSQDLKPNNMTLISQTQAKMDKSGSQRLMVLQPCLSKSMSIKKWGVKIIKLASWIGVGVCHINEIKKANFMFNYTNTGHGNYLISSNGYSWSSYKKQYNSKFEPFTFTTGDIIHLEYDPKERIIKFKKESDANQPTYELEVEANDDPVHPEINLTGINDEVELINF